MKKVLNISIILIIVLLTVCNIININADDVNIGNTTTLADNNITNKAKYTYQSNYLKVQIYRHQLHNPNHIYYIAEVWIKDMNQFKTCFSYDTYNDNHNVYDNTLREEGSVMAKRNNAVFAVNGSHNIGLCVHDKQVFGKLKNNRNICLIYDDGSMKVYTDYTNFDINQELDKGLLHAWQFGPALIQNNKILYNKKEGRAPRTAIGYIEPYHYVFLTCVGRCNKAIGMTTDELANILYDFGCTEAFNLDGGYSSNMLFNGKRIMETAYKNRWNNGKKMDGRPINDLIYFVDIDSNLNKIIVTNYINKITNQFGSK